MGTTRFFRWAAAAAFLGALAPAAAAAALRAAQAKLLADQATSHPALWAPFVLVGDGGAP